MTREERARDIAIICGKCGCTTEQKKRHYKLFVDEQWMPHASLRFKRWWYQQPEYRESIDDRGTGIDPVAAQNTLRFWNKYLEEKQCGAA